MKYRKAAEQISLTATLSHEQLAKIGISVSEVLPAQFARIADDLKEVLVESLVCATDERQKDKVDVQNDIQVLRESIEEQGQRQANLDDSVQKLQQFILEVFECCSEAYLQTLLEGINSNDARPEGGQSIESIEIKVLDQVDPMVESATTQNLFVGMAAGLHLLGYLMAGKLGPMLRSPSSAWAAGNNERFEPTSMHV